MSHYDHKTPNKYYAENLLQNIIDTSKIHLKIHAMSNELVNRWIQIEIKLTEAMIKKKYFSYLPYSHQTRSSDVSFFKNWRATCFCGCEYRASGEILAKLDGALHWSRLSIRLRNIL